MALIDFFQLAVLFKLSCGDVGVFSNPSHPPPMPATKPPSSSFPPGERGRINSFISPSVQPPPRPQERKHDATHSAPNPTPPSVGTSTLPKLSLDTYQVSKYDSTRYEQYTAQDFEHHRVFIDIDVFMERVLHVPENWREVWGPAIKKIKLDKAFSSAGSNYSRQCKIEGFEKRFYKPLVDMANAILRCSESSLGDCVKPRTYQRYLVNDPQRLSGGIMNDLSPDIVAVHHDFLPHLRPEELKQQEIQRTNISWAHPLQVLEVKPSGGALVDGSCMPRLMVNGKPVKTSCDVVL